MVDHKLEAEYYRIGLLVGILHLADIIAWADHALLSEPEVDPALLDISLAGSKTIKEVDSLLRGVRGRAELAPSAELFSGAWQWKFGMAVAMWRQLSGMPPNSSNIMFLPDRLYGEELC